MRHLLNPAGRWFLKGQVGVLLVVLLGAAAGARVAAVGTVESSTITGGGVDAITAGVLPTVVALLQVVAVWPPRVSGFERRTDPWAAFKLVQVRHAFALTLSATASAAVPVLMRLVAGSAVASGCSSAGTSRVVSDVTAASSGTCLVTEGMGLLVLRNVMLGMVIGSACRATERPGLVALVALPALCVLSGVPAAVVNWYLRPPGSPAVVGLVAAQVVALLLVAAYRMLRRT